MGNIPTKALYSSYARLRGHGYACALVHDLAFVSSRSSSHYRGGPKFSLSYCCHRTLSNALWHWRPQLSQNVSITLRLELDCELREMNIIQL
ncbi:hypothetical protein RR46_02488 [Papilio xuthus]|uniref:Uncharacterized protein n=1 Tax=Papilio xuthus TaxID=66420 RepID=A0A194QMT1_PAPXU|nr:hypothetical protein RR46_02488 [Papilio xuthus]